MTLWIGTSWKMNKTLAEARAYADKLNEVPHWPDQVRPFVLPPFTALAAVRDTLRPDVPVLLGAQNAHWEPAGAHTGEVSMAMVADAGARLVEIGHSERREQFNETDQTVALKVRAALANRLRPLLCVGEPAEVRDRGGEVDFVIGQIRSALDGLPAGQLSRVLIAYEPVWAIGEHGQPATAEDIAPVIAAIARQYKSPHHPQARIGTLLYGGSVDPGNAGPLLRVPQVDGLFVGRAAWQPAGLLRLLAIASSAPH